MNEDANLLAQLARPPSSNAGFPRFNLAFGGGLPPIGSFMGMGSGPGTTPSDHLYGYGPTSGGTNGLNNYNSAAAGNEQSRPTVGMPSLGRASVGSHHRILQVVSSSDSRADNNSDTANHIRGGDAAAGSSMATDSKSRTIKQYAMVPLGPPSAALGTSGGGGTQAAVSVASVATEDGEVKAKKWKHWVSRRTMADVVC